MTSWVPRPEPPFLADSRRDPAGAQRRLAACESRWGLHTRGPLSGGNRSEVFDCVTTAGREVVVKLAAHSFEAATEAAALTAWAPTGAAVALLDVDYENAALLLERLRPGTALVPGGGADVVEIATDLLGRLHVPVPPDSGFPRLSDLYDVFERWLVADNAYERRVRAEPGRGAVALARLPAARRTAMALSADAARTVLLHGDFCDKNLLLNGTRYITVDPIARVGDPCSDIGFFAAGRPPVADILDLTRAVAGRLGEDPVRAERWAAVWTIHQAAQAWRSDQAELDAFAGGEDAERLLAV